MAHYLTSDDKYRGLPDSNENRSSLSGYQFGRARGIHGRGRTALGQVKGYLKTVIEAIANSKLRRMRRELELRGVRFDQANESPVAHKSEPAEQSR
jgi:hypothetical protein